MILVDAGPLVALIDAGEKDHDRCVQALSLVSLPLVTTWPAVTEAVYLLGSVSGYAGQEPLWQLVLDKRLDIAQLSSSAVARSAELMRKYADVPMNLADSTLVALAEERAESRIFTLDSDFLVYRIHDRKAFQILPAR